MGFINRFSPHIPTFFIVVIISLYLVLRWLPNEMIIAGADIGIPNLLPQKQFSEMLSSWWDTHGTGVSSSTGYTSIPYYLFLTLLDSVGFTHDITQKIVFFLVITGGSLSIYFLALNFSFTRWTATLAALFYIFNLTSLSVWQRAVHNAIFMLLLAPLSLLVLSWGIKHKKYSSIILINLVSFALVYVFGSFGYVFSLWLLWTIYIFTIMYSKWRDKSLRKFILTYFFLLIISWIGTNSWWILPVLTSSSYALGQLATSELTAKSSDVLAALKPYHEPTVILRGLSRFYHYIVKDWGEIYSNTFFILLSWIPTLIVFLTTLIKSNHKSIPWKYLITLICIVLVFSKGVNPPLGYLNKLPLDTFHFLTPLRNPYEKIGILLAIPFSLLFALGINQIYSFFKKRFVYLNILIFLIVGLSISVLVWPLWAGKLFVSEGRKYAVSIPSYYLEADEWLAAKISADDTRILHLPLAWGESVDYDWGYSGIEPSQYFFRGSSIGYHLAITSLDSRFRDLLLLIHKQNTLDIQKAFASLNIGWVVVHNETLYRDRILESPERINEWLKTNPYFLEHQQDIGSLSIWKVKDQYRIGHFYSIGKLVSISKPQFLSTLRIWDNLQNLEDGFFTKIQKEHNDDLSKFVGKNIVFPSGKIKYSPLGTINAEAALREIAIIKHLPDSPIYPLIILKEKILAFLNQNDSVRDCFSLSGKRLKEAALFARQANTEGVRETLIGYESQLDKCTQISKEKLGVYLSTDFLKEEILGQLIRQRALLENEFTNSSLKDFGNNARLKLNEYLAKIGLISKYTPKTSSEDNQQIIVFTYSVFNDGQYNIQLEKPQAELIKSPPRIVQIDDEQVDLSPQEVNEKYIKYAPYSFAAGFHEIHLEVGEEKNLIEISLESKKISPDTGFKYQEDPQTKEGIFIGEAKGVPVSLVFDLPKVDVEQKYEVFFDIYLDQDASPIFTITHDTDPFSEGGKLKPAVRRELQFVSYPVLWRSITQSYLPPLNANSAELAFTLKPWNDCAIVLSESECIEKSGGSYRSDRSITVKLKNIRVEKVFDSDLVLEEINIIAPQVLGKTDIKWSKKSPVSYNINLSNQKTPYILTFSETFHPLWQIINQSGEVIDLPHFSINGFANGWLIESPLPEKIQVHFLLQDSLSKGTIIAMVSFVISLGLLVYFDKRRKIR